MLTLYVSRFCCLSKPFHSLSFIGEPITPSAASSPEAIECRVRYRDPRVGINFYPTLEAGNSAAPPTTRSARITFTQPQRALASGQIMALYRGEQLLGGGVFA